MKKQSRNRDKHIATYIDELRRAITDEKFFYFALTFCSVIVQLYKKGATLYLCGNGGNAATLSHMACDLNLHPFVKEDKSGFPINPNGFRVVNMCESPAVLTALANDGGWHNVFASQLSGATQSDVILLVSGSGSSSNTTAAMLLAKQKKMFTFGMARKEKCALREGCSMFYCAGGEAESKFPGQTGANNNNFIFEDCVQMLGHMATGILKEEVAKNVKS
jgi:D-sedoheptulose 7-phosphate isomerase